MSKRIFISFVLLAIMTGCQYNAPEIQTLCLRDGIGNYLIKWETTPPMEGVVKIYVSNNPDKFTRKEPAIYADINQGVVTYVTNDNVTRQYFRLTFNDKYGQVVGARSVLMDNVQNLRDLGGYVGEKNRMIRWGKVYRSGDVSRLSFQDSLRLSNLHLKTIIDLRSAGEMNVSPITFEEAQIVTLPLTVGNLENIQPFLREGKMRKGDATVYMQDMYLKFITDNHEAFAKALQIFLDKDNYPILFSCSLGKDATGYLSTLLLQLLAVPDQMVTRDYLASNEYIIMQRYAYMVRDLSFESQEAITTLLSVNELFLQPVRQKILRDYTSFDNFVETALEFSEKDRDRLKDILLY
ncbi:protein tyrosine/serine phosphatase [Parabacteroides sp. PFB2-10]|uniref:tyrosine-protein phosphatase n=1 Tax=Parabacteroides sp. PFB2-10 TaxID=1742405 RepID=UPI0024765C63|nr:tyrosine-protein phosphatase [Parabacteroides sp. PFB2-10]MDH6311470.1 protein tyrosine/serine phosphatase [Parabacteroides sp. PFB2-10]